MPPVRAPLLEYAKSHAYNTMDSRPDTSDIPQRASQSSGSGSTPLPTATPTKFTASYEVEDSGKGTLTGNGQTGVSSVEIQAESGTSVNVTAVAADGFVFISGAMALRPPPATTTSPRISPSRLCSTMPAWS